MSEIQEMFEQNRFQEMKDLFQFEHDNAFFMSALVVNLVVFLRLHVLSKDFTALRTEL